MFALLVFFFGAAEALDFIVRYAVLDSSRDQHYLLNNGIPMLRSSMCLAERHLEPAVRTATGASISYVIYTDAATHELVFGAIMLYFSHLVGRLKLINLDEDHQDELRLQPISGVDLDVVNAACVRRALADTAHLPSQSGRLLLGLDV
mmetsp:Transcript_116876/g.330674  ORF Transcript_116876/g.330674 Transcript_116876/m.330674 type:complete len:148 (-) Transcript_116876:9-452(-)